MNRRHFMIRAVVEQALNQAPNTATIGDLAIAAILALSDLAPVPSILNETRRP